MFKKTIFQNTVNKHRTQDTEHRHRTQNTNTANFRSYCETQLVGKWAVGIRLTCHLVVTVDLDALLSPNWINSTKNSKN